MSETAGRGTLFPSCPGRYEVTAGQYLSCSLPSGHEGIHLASIQLNGMDCDTGWRDSDPGAFRDLCSALKESLRG